MSQSEYEKKWRKEHRQLYLERRVAHDRKYKLKKRNGGILPSNWRELIKTSYISRPYKKILTDEERKAKIRQYHYRYYHKYPEKMKEVRIKNREKNNKWLRIYQKNARMKCLIHYSQGNLKCAKCGFSDIRALQIDHVNGGGVKHIKEINGNLPIWLIKHKFPEGYQVLCANCNWVKRVENNEVKNNDKNNKEMEKPNQPTQPQLADDNMRCNRIREVIYSNDISKVDRPNI